MKTKTFGKFTASIEPNEDREGVNCYIDIDGLTSSLACAEGEGMIDGQIVISPATLDRIHLWAESNGY